MEGDYHTINYDGAVVPFCITLAPYGRLKRNNKDVVLHHMRLLLNELVAESDITTARAAPDVEAILGDLSDRIDQIVNDRGAHAKWINSLHIPERRTE